MSSPEKGTPGSLGLLACIAIVVGNMVGSGFYLSPAALAPFGMLAIVAWIVMAIGAICLGLSFARLARLAPATGGPYVYTRLAYGDFAGFMIAWGYWISIWASLPVIALALTGAVFNMLPQLRDPMMALALTLGAIWAVVLVNLRGVKAAGRFAVITTYSKLIPFAAVAILGLLYIDPGSANLTEFNPSGMSLLDATAALAPLTMFAFLGLESATVPADDVKNPERTVPRATIIGISIAALLYIFGTVAVFGVLPREELMNSVAPFSDAAHAMWGPIGAVTISLAVILSSIGALNGWTLLMGQVPMAAARDGLFPSVFGKVSGRGVPTVGLLISALFATVLLLTQTSNSPSLRSIYHLVVNLSTMTAVIPYAFCAVAGGLVAARVAGGPVRHVTAVDLIAFLFALFTIYGCGPEPVLYGLMLLLFGIPVYVYQRRRLSELGRDNVG